MNEKTDRRIQRTRRQLQDALKELILEKGYENVRIEDITERADLGRTTFYLHYKNKDVLLTSILEEVYDVPILKIESAPTVDEMIKVRRENRSYLFHHVAENADFYRIILSGQGGALVAKHHREYVTGLTQRMLDAIKEEYQITPLLPLGAMLAFLSSALMGLISWWLENDMEIPPEEMFQMYYDLAKYGYSKEVEVSETKGK